MNVTFLNVLISRIGIENVSNVLTYMNKFTKTRANLRDALPTCNPKHAIFSQLGLPENTSTAELYTELRTTKISYDKLCDPEIFIIYILATAQAELLLQFNKYHFAHVTEYHGAIRKLLSHHPDVYAKLRERAIEEQHPELLRLLRVSALSDDEYTQHFSSNIRPVRALGVLAQNKYINPNMKERAIIKFYLQQRYRCPIDMIVD